MQTNTQKTRILVLFGLVAAGAASMAADYTWDGGGGNGNWNTGLNWVGDNAPTVAAHNLYFSGTSQLSTTNNLLTSVSSLTFTASAGAFALGGNALTLAGNVVNTSASAQTLSLNLALSGNRVFNTQFGDMDVTGILSETSAGRQLRKEGIHTLTLSGNNSYTGSTQVMAGRLLLDATTGKFSNNLTLGQTTGGYNVGNTTTFEVVGGNYDLNSALGIYNYAANTVKAGNAVALRFTNLSNTSYGTVNVDVSAAGSSVTFDGAVSTTGGLGRIHLTTVTDATNTGFARIDTEDGNKIVRLTDAELTDISAATDLNTQAKLNGSFVMTGYKGVNSLTLQNSGGGTLSGAAQTLTVREILMEEGAGDYTLSNGRIAQHGLSPNFVALHQYSTDGTLIINAALLGDGATQGLIKTGPGTVHVTESSASNYTGETRLQSGRFELDGTLSGTALMRVFDGTILAGGGSYGTSSTSTQVYAGGTLEGASDRALAVSGALTLDSNSHFAFTLGQGTDSVDVTGAVTLQGYVTLNLSLAGAPDALDTPLYLLTSDTGITGNFVFNGSVMTSGTEFSLGGYDFTYFQDGSNIWVQAVPEPSVVLLVGLGTAFVLFRRRRQISE